MNPSSAAAPRTPSHDAPVADLPALCHALIDAARKAGAENADAMAYQNTSISVDVLKGKLEHAERSEGLDVGLRVLIGKKQACVSASDVSPATLACLAERAVAMAGEAPEDPTCGLADPGELGADRDFSALDLFDPSASPASEDLMDSALRAEAEALRNSGISTVQSAGASYGRQAVHLAGSNGLDFGYQRSSRGCHVVAITGSGTAMERDYYGDSRIYGADLKSPEEIGRIAAERTVERAGARKPKSGSFPVLYDERVSSSLISHVLSAANGIAIARGASWLRNRLGEQILPKGMDLVEDPRRARVSGSRVLDAEGLPTRARKIIDDGCLTGWTLDLATARKLGMTSTGNAARGLTSPPSPTAWNVALTQGTVSREQLIKDMGTGLLVTSMIGMSVNSTTGDYSRGASGFWVENGEIQYAVNECTIAGNLNDMLASLVAANDAQTHLSHVVPSLLVDGLTLAGA